MSSVEPGGVEPGGDDTHGAEPATGDDTDARRDAGEPLSAAELESALEALLLVVDSPAGLHQLASVLGESPVRIEQTLRRMSARLTERGSGIDLRYAGGGWRFYTRDEFAPYVERFLQGGARSKLTRAALETLAVVAYRQPVTRARVSAVRGVNVDGVMRTLLARGLIAEAGIDPDGNAMRYATTELFLERLGIASLADLPPLAPLLPDVDLIDDISDDLEADPRFATMNKNSRSKPTPDPEFDREDRQESRSEQTRSP